MKNRITNIVICSMQITATYATFFALLIHIGQEGNFSLVIKTFVSLTIITTFDNKFSAAFPKEVKENAQALLASNKLVIGSDNNTFYDVGHRLSHEVWRVDAWFKAIINTLINLWYHFCHFSTTVFYNYFGAIFTIVIQFIGLIN